MRTRRILIISSLAVVFVVTCVAVVAGVFLTQAIQRERSTVEAEGRATYSNENAQISMAQNLSFDPRDREALRENSEEVFVGEVERLEEHADNDPLPFLEGWTATARYTVRVEEVRKDASGDDLESGQTVTVNQLGVPPPDAEATVCFGNDYPGGYVPAQRLREGMRYVFSTEYYRREGYHEVRVDPFGWMVLSEEAPPDVAPDGGSDRLACPGEPEG